MYKGIVNENNLEQISQALYNMKGRAIGHLQNEEYQSCIDICIKGLNVSPYDSEFMLLIAESFEKAGDVKNAIKWFKKASRQRPNDKVLRQIIYDLEKKGYTDIQLSF